MFSFKDYKINFKSFGCDQSDAILLISGFTADMSIWESFADRLKSNFRILIFDNLGVGESSQPEELSIELMADAAHALAVKEFDCKYHVVGHSMGGAIAQNIARKYPKDIKSLTSFCSFSKLGALFRIVCKQKGEMYENNIPCKFIDQIALPWAFSKKFLEKENTLEELISYQKENPSTQSKIGYLSQLDALLEFNSKDWLNEINVPTLLVAGENDIISPVEDSKVIFEKIENSELHILKDVGHVPMLEDEDNLLVKFNDFISKIK